SHEIEAWHLPTYTASLDMSYNLENKIIARLNVYAISKRNARIDHINAQTNENMPEAKELNGVIDANLGLEYRITKRFSSFLDLNNIAGQRYYEWNQYANQRFNFMLGLTYTF
ncbi:MAG: TonB-dependent receptor, partial [Salinivirgaceae bacterium]|nr:TonB-dependent receptor [Salinivirgaceae bacterium]